MTIMSIFLNNLMAVMALMVVGWLVSVARRNVTVVDSLWGLGFVLIAWSTWLQSQGYAGRQLLLAGLTTVWGLRLAVYLTLRNRGKAEDPRYAAWRREGGRWFWLTSLFKVFLLCLFQFLEMLLVFLVDFRCNLTEPLPNFSTHIQRDRTDLPPAVMIFLQCLKGLDHRGFQKECLGSFT